MLNQTEFGEKLRRHRKNIGMTQEEAAEKIRVSAQAVSKWESGECLPDCFNLKAICDIYNLSADVLLKTEYDSDIDNVADKIEQLGTEFIWAAAGIELHRLNELLQLFMENGIIEFVSDARISSVSKRIQDKRPLGNCGVHGSCSYVFFKQKMLYCMRIS